MNLLPIIIAGAATGGLSCFAVQGGLLTSAIANARKIRDQKNNNTAYSDFKQIFAFIGAKLIAYTILGALLGAFGGAIQINSQMQSSIQIVIGLYMLGLALNLLNVHPIFKYFVFQPPHSLQRFIRKIAKGHDEFATPALLGLLTLAIPCGTTLAMEALAITSGSSLEGAAIMATFVVSSSWTFIAIGIASSRLTDNLQIIFYKITGVVLVALALFTINTGLNLSGVRLTSNDRIADNVPRTPQVKSANFEYDKQIVHIKVTSRGYEADTKVLRKGIPVELRLETQNSYSCANAFVIPGLNISKVLPTTGSETVTFTPQKEGKLAYSCSMGMYTGEFTVQ